MNYISALSVDELNLILQQLSWKNLLTFSLTCKIYDKLRDHVHNVLKNEHQNKSYIYIYGLSVTPDMKKCSYHQRIDAMYSVTINHHFHKSISRNNHSNNF